MPPPLPSNLCRVLDLLTHWILLNLSHGGMEASRSGHQGNKSKGWILMIIEVLILGELDDQCAWR